MKCSRCGTTFVVPLDDAPPAPKASPSRPPFFEDASEDEPRPAKKSAASKPAFVEDDQGNIELEEPQPRARGKGKAAGRAVEEAAAPRKQPAPASGCAGCVLSIFVLFIVLGYSAALAALQYYPEIVSEYVELPFTKPPAEVGKFHNIPHDPNAGNVENDADGEKKDGDTAKDKKDTAKDNDKKDANTDAADKDKDKVKDKDNVKDKDKDAKGDDADKDKQRDNDNTDAASEGEGMTPIQATPMAITPANQPGFGRPAKPASNDRKNHRAASA